MQSQYVCFLVVPYVILLLTKHILEPKPWQIIFHPKRVNSPKQYWSLIDVLDDAGPEDVAVALGRWDGKPTLAMRWNGADAEKPLGNPQSRGIPVWFILPQGKYAEAIIKALSPEKRALVRNFIPAP